MNRTISALVAQFPIGLDLRANRDAILDVIGRAAPQTLIVLPEGALSGYAEDPAFLAAIDPADLDAALGELRAAVARRQVHLVFGSCLREDGAWFNAGIYAGPRHELFIYRKVNLAISERGAFRAGERLDGPLLEIAGQQVRLGIQLCREIRFPEQWQLLARGGAQIFAYLTNAVGDAAPAPVWRSHLISRAAENQRFVLAANAAHPAQKCPSMIVTPAGEVAWEALSANAASGHASLDLAAVADWYLGQSRRDLCG
jgi:predicted amidohydrolase